MKKGGTIKWLDTVESTQDEVLRASASLGNLDVIAAREQTAGRGQRGNRWSSARGENLTFSMLLRFGGDGFPPLPAACQFVISEATTLAVSSFLERLGVGVRIKWPNDLYVGDRKICGMLIENSLACGRLSRSIVGIGLNLNQTVFPPALLNPTSVRRQCGISLDPEAALEDLHALLAEEFSLFEVPRVPQDGSLDRLRQRYLEKLYRKDRRYPYTDRRSGTVFTGCIRDVTPEGLLAVEDDQGRIRNFGFKEISYIL